MVMPDPHSTIQEEEPESKPTFVKQVSTLLVFFYLVLFVNQIHFKNSDGHLVAPTMQTSLTKQYSSPMLGQRRYSNNHSSSSSSDIIQTSSDQESPATERFPQRSLLPADGRAKPFPGASPSLRWELAAAS